MDQFSEWLSATGLSQTIQLNSWAIPAIQTIHILALARRFSRLIWLLLVVLALSGLLLITAAPFRTIKNLVFYARMIMLALAILLTLWLSAASKREPERISNLHRGGAALTMLLWIGIIFAGRFIAYTEAF